jgi:Holliday junction resolvase RusA-like endonuclease
MSNLSMIPKMIQKEIKTIYNKNIDKINDLLTYIDKRKNDSDKFNIIDEARQNIIDFNYRIDLSGNLYPSPRPRVGRSRGCPIIYLPNDYQHYKKELGEIIVEDFRKQGFIDVINEVPLMVNILFKVNPPKSVTKLEQFLNLLLWRFPTIKPDLDNLEKTIIDSMNGVIYADDSQIVGLSSFKIYTDDEEGFVLWVSNFRGFDYVDE